MLSLPRCCLSLFLYPKQVHWSPVVWEKLCSDVSCCYLDHGKSYDKFITVLQTVHFCQSDFVQNHFIKKRKDDIQTFWNSLDRWTFPIVYQEVWQARPINCYLIKCVKLTNVNLLKCKYVTKLHRRCCQERGQGDNYDNEHLIFLNLYLGSNLENYAKNVPGEKWW